MTNQRTTIAFLSERLEVLQTENVQLASEKAASLEVSLDGVEIRDPESDPRRGDFEAEYVELRIV